MKTNTLLEIVSRYLAIGYFDNEVRDIVRQVKQDDELDSEQLKFLYSYVARCQQKDMSSGRSDFSIKEMKQTIMKMIGSDSLINSYSSTVSRPELKAIYNFIVNLPSEVFLNKGSNV